PDLARITYNVIIVEIEARYRPVRHGAFWFFDDAASPPVFIERHHSVSFGVAHLIGKYRRASIARTRNSKHLRQAVAKKYIIAEHKRTRALTNEIRSDQKCLRKSFWLWLYRVAKSDTPLAPVTQQPLKLSAIIRRRDNKDVANTSKHQRRQRIIDHRFVENRQQLLADTAGYRIEPCSTAAGQNNAL